MRPKLASGIWVAAYLRRLTLASIPAYVTWRGDAQAGAVMVKLARLDGTATVYQRQFDFDHDTYRWQVLRDGPEREVDTMLARQRAIDRDLWVIEIEDARGRHLLDEEGLAE